MKNIRYCSFPRTAKAALAELLNRGAEAVAVAGGTLSAKTLPETTEKLVDLGNLPLAHIRKQGADLVIGAMATFDEIDNSRLAKNWAGGVLSAAAARCSSQLIRNRATIGGNIARPHSFNIFPAVLLGLGAGVRVLAKTGVKTIPFSGLYQPEFKFRPGRDCLLLEVIVPAGTRNWACRFEKFARTEASWEAYLTLFMGADVKGGIIREISVAVGSLSPRPFRAAQAESALSGGKLSAAAIKAAVRGLELDLDSARAGEFRKEAAGSLFRRFLEGI